MSTPNRIAVIGSGISGLSAAWLLSRHHDVTLFEADPRPGGHSNTVDAPHRSGGIAVDTGFIVYNVASYPNLIALFQHLDVPTAPTDMSFAVSLDHGRYEYAGSSLATMFGQPANIFSVSHWRMISDIVRFFREAPNLEFSAQSNTMTLGAYLDTNGYSKAFVDRHILPMAAAIWSTPSNTVLDFPIASFVRFFSNHGLLQIRDRPQWRTVVGGSREYVKRILADYRGEVKLGEPVRRIERRLNGVTLQTGKSAIDFDSCVVATHADDALALLGDPDADERALLGTFRYSQNLTVLHSDQSHMPRRKRLWSSWNYLSSLNGDEKQLSVTYWMNKLQPLNPDSPDLFVSLNPNDAIAPGKTIAQFNYAHPIFDAAAMGAQRQLWQLQGRKNTWFCGSYFGYGFHEDGIQSGLAVAEDIGGVRRPWTVANESGRIHISPPDSAPQPAKEAAE